MSSSQTSRKRKRESEEAHSSHDDIEIIERASKRSAITICDFRFHYKLGQGSYGQVFLASVIGENRMVAIKVVPKELEDKTDIIYESRILQEARDSPFVCKTHAGFQNKNNVYYIMEYLPGGSLQALINKCGFLDEDKVKFYAAELVCGLQYLHLRGIVHRDIKPDNIMMDHDGHIKIIDLGLARDGLIGSAKTSRFCGTLRYMAPEIMKNQPYGKEVDWWSLGITLCQMMTGNSPFYAGAQRKRVKDAIINEKPYFPPSMSTVSHHFLNELLNKKPGCRLGATGDIRQHPFFDGINWKELEERRVEPPFRPFLNAPVLKKYPPEAAATQSNRWPRLTFRAPSWT